MADWTVPKGRRTCAGCQREFRPAEPMVSVLFLREQALVREDRCAACEPAADRVGAVSHWRTAAPTPDQPKRAKLDAEAAGELFRRLVTDLKPEQRALCYVLGLVLVRRKSLRLVRQEEGPPLEPVPVPESGAPSTLPPPPSSLPPAPATYLILEERDTGTTYRLPDLMLSDPEIDRVTGELKDLFQGDV